jgi:hypothetical protein
MVFYERNVFQYIWYFTTPVMTALKTKTLKCKPNALQQSVYDYASPESYASAIYSSISWIDPYKNKPDKILCHYNIIGYSRLYSVMLIQQFTCTTNQSKLSLEDGLQPVSKVGRGPQVKVFQCNHDLNQTQILIDKHKFVTASLWLHITDPAVNLSMRIVPKVYAMPLQRTKVKKLEFFTSDQKSDYMNPSTYYSEDDYLTIKVTKFSYTGFKRNVPASLLRNPLPNESISHYVRNFTLVDLMPQGM